MLRFWETKFTFITPMKRAGGRRFYRPNDVAVLQGVRRLLHEQGLTLKGVQRLYKEKGLKAVAGFSEPDDAPAGEASAGSTVDRARLRTVLAELEAARARLDHALGR